ncbi:hypothetical protein M1397_03105 [Candidatus Marsarchaeota archaeon]|nr:hypothetical protein [Candidatus Marsarchaeota archaeon]
MAKKRGRYSAELEKLKLLKSINSMLKTSDIENALLSNSAKESEIVSDSTIDALLSKAESKNTAKDIDLFEREYAKETSKPPARKNRARPAARRKIKTRKASKRNAGKKKHHKRR